MPNRISHFLQCTHTVLRLDISKCIINEGRQKPIRWGGGRIMKETNWKGFSIKVGRKIKLGNILFSVVNLKSDWLSCDLAASFCINMPS